MSNDASPNYSAASGNVVDSATPEAPAAVTGSSNSALGSSSSRTPNTPATAPAGTSSGSFTNIRNYLNANQGNSLGNQVGGRIQQNVNKTQGDINQAKSDFDTQNQQGQGAAFNQETFDKVQQAKNLTDPNNAIDPNAIKNQLTSTYKGPQGLANQDVLANQASNLAQQGQATGTEAGRLGLLQQYFTTPSQQYSGGQPKLDQLLLQSTPGQMQALQQARAGTAQVGQQVQQAGNAAQNTAQQSQAAADQNKQLANKAFGEAQTSVGNDLTNAVN